MASAKDCHTLISYYEKLYKEKYGTAPVVNRHTARWSFDGMLKGMSMAEVKSTLEYYLTTNNASRHKLDWFFYNYDKLLENRRDSESDSEHRAKLRRESEQRAREWREKFGNEGITRSQFGSEE